MGTATGGFSPAVLIEAKIAGDDGPAPDKATRIVDLATMRDERIQQGRAGFQVVACIDRRGFGVRREDMRRMLLKTAGKVFTLVSLDQLIQNTRIREFFQWDEKSGQVRPATFPPTIIPTED